MRDGHQLVASTASSVFILLTSLYRIVPEAGRCTFLKRLIEPHLSVATDLHQLASAQVHFHPGVAQLDVPQQQSHHLLATSYSASYDIGKHS